MKTFFVLMSVLASITAASAGISAAKRAAIVSRAETYFLLVGNGQLAGPAECTPPSTQDCIVFVAGSYPSSDERITAAKACVGNYGVTCAKWAAGSYPSFDERVTAARACRDNRTTECAVFVAGSYPSSDERLTAVRACGNADIACVKYVAGSYPSFDERVAAAKSCSDQN
ncbi:MAG: hypothetical protein JST04_15925 [Bdellovibrionales bacterium]|nr:hypothetical protein [Bdellovibrionales bacterium]